MQTQGLKSKAAGSLADFKSCISSKLASVLVSLTGNLYCQQTVALKRKEGKLYRKVVFPICLFNYEKQGAALPKWDEKQVEVPASSKENDHGALCRNLGSGIHGTPPSPYYPESHPVSQQITSEFPLWVCDFRRKLETFLIYFKKIK